MVIYLKKGKKTHFVLSFTAGWNVVLSTYLENSMNLLGKLRIELPYDLAISFWDIYPLNLKAFIEKGLYSPLFIAALSIIAKI